MGPQNVDQLAPLTWIEGAPFPADCGGPDTVPFTPLQLGSQSGITDYVEAAARTHPDKIAIVSDQRSVTYAELVDRMLGLAARLIDATPPGGVVASIVQNGPAAMCTVLAALKSGRTFIPIDAGHPVERQSALFSEAYADAVVVERGIELDTSFVPSSVQLLELDVYAPTGATALPDPPAPNGPRLVMFTSGSTGRPKGLAIGLADQADMLSRMVARSHFNDRDVFASLASMSQTGLADLVGLAVGAEVHVIDFRRLGFARALAAFKDAGVTVLSFVPSVLRTVLALPGIEQTFSKLRLLSLHGEKILASDIELFRSKLPPDCKIAVTLGSTEAGAIFSWYVRDEALDGPVAPVGYLLEGVRIALINEDGRPAAPGEVGELLVRGPIAMGSWQNGQVTPARFIQDSDDPTANVYVTGDLVRQRPDKLFEFVGRRDRQVKIRGLWADLGEVESALRAADDVDDAVVMVHSREGEADALAAFITLADPSRPPSMPELRRQVAVGTAEHMVPAIIQVLPEIPRLANYKPDLVCLDAMLRRPSA